jgi:hypothetical protein
LPQEYQVVKDLLEDNNNISKGIIFGGFTFALIPAIIGIGWVLKDGYPHENACSRL